MNTTLLIAIASIYIIRAVMTSCRISELREDLDYYKNSAYYLEDSVRKIENTFYAEVDTTGFTEKVSAIRKIEEFLGIKYVPANFKKVQGGYVKDKSKKQ